MYIDSAPILASLGNPMRDAGMPQYRIHRIRRHEPVRPINPSLMRANNAWSFYSLLRLTSHIASTAYYC